MGGASSVPARETTREDRQACDVTGKSKRPRDHCAPGNQNSLCRDVKRVRSCDIGGGSGSIVCYDGRQLDCSDEETQSLLFSSRAAASGDVQAPSRSGEDVQHFRSFKIDPTKHKIFLSHSGAQKNFVEQLCVDLEARGYFFPFFDQRQHSLPKGKDFVPLIKQAARLCRVAVIVLSKEFLSSKWPMIELAEFYAAKQGGNNGMNMLPLFYKLSVGDLDDQSIEDRWMLVWKQFASKDKRIDVTQWAAAVRELRGANGLLFGKNTNSKVAYRKEIVQSIWKLSPAELLNDSARDMAGYNRICQIVSEQFVEGTGVGASVLGLYGTSGLGKTTVSMALRDYFIGEFWGRVCHVQLDAMTRKKRQELMLRTLCGIEEDVLRKLTDVPKGLKFMRDCMNREPVLLVIDNVTNDVSSRKEAHDYLTVGFHPKSKIMITSRSREVLQGLLPGANFCMSVPRLNEEEAGRIFLRSAAPTKCFSSLTDEERRILRLCIEKCLLESDEEVYPVQVENPDNSILSGLPAYRAYHPLALSALGDFFCRFCANTEMLLWKDSLGGNNELMRDVLQSPSITSIIGLQFNTLRASEKLLFLDIALFMPYEGCGVLGEELGGHDREFDMWVKWLSALHGMSASAMERRLRDLKRSGMIDWKYYMGCSSLEVEVHSLYKEFAVWYVTEHGVTGLKNVSGVFQSYGTSLGFDHPGPKCISELVRLRVFDSTLARTRILASKRMRELQNLVLLQLHFCTELRELSLEGLDSLRHLELVGLSELVRVTLTGSSGSQEDRGIFESLQYVLLMHLESLTHVPDFRSCSSLFFLHIDICRKLSNFKGVECPYLEMLVLKNFRQHQFKRPPNFRSLHSMRILVVELFDDVDFVEAMDSACSYNWMGSAGVEGVVRLRDPDNFSGYHGVHREDGAQETWIINRHCGNRFAKEGLSIVQKVLSRVTRVSYRRRQSSSRDAPSAVRWVFDEDEKEQLQLDGSSPSCYGRSIEWRFRSPEEYAD